MRDMYEVYQECEGAKWLGKPIPSTFAINEFLKELRLQSKYILILEPVEAHKCLIKFFGIPEEQDKFVEFMFDASLTHQILGVCQDNDTRGKNLKVVIGESPRHKTNIDATVIDTIIRKFEKEMQ